MKHRRIRLLRRLANNKNTGLWVIVSKKEANELLEGCEAPDWEIDEERFYTLIESINDQIIDDTNIALTLWDQKIIEDVAKFM